MTTNTRLRSFFGVLLLLLPLAAFGQDLVGADAVSEGLTAHGHAEVKVKPDIARLSVSVTTQAGQQASAAQDNARRTTALLAALKGAGISDEDIQTSGYTVQPQYDDKHSPPVLTGYQVTNSVDVTVRDLGRVGAVLDRATGAGATGVGDVSYDLADRTAAERRALALAVTEARAKAGAMATAAGVGLGRLLSLGEGSPVVVRPLVFQRAVLADAVGSPAPPTPVGTQQITVTADVTAVYALGQ